MSDPTEPRPSELWNGTSDHGYDTPTEPRPAASPGEVDLLSEPAALGASGWSSGRWREWYARVLAAGRLASLLGSGEGADAPAGEGHASPDDDLRALAEAVMVNADRPAMPRSAVDLAEAVLAALLPAPSDEARCICDGAAYMPDQRHPFIVHPECPRHGKPAAPPTPEVERAKVILFKATGKYYTEEEWRIPSEEEARANGMTSAGDMVIPYVMRWSPDFRRIGDGAVLVDTQEPWGYPHLITEDRP